MKDYGDVCIHGDLDIVGTTATYPTKDCLECEENYGYFNPNCEFYFAYKWTSRKRDWRKGFRGEQNDG